MCITKCLDRHEDSQIVQFFRRVQQDELKRFVLTSRTTVLNQAKIKSDQFSIANVDRAEFEITVEKLSTLDKAKILRKHIWHSELSAVLTAEVLTQRRYRTIIDHKNFNPRLIQFLFDAQRFKGLSGREYWERVLNMLERPIAIWEHVFDSQLNDYVRALLLLCCYHGRALSEQDLRDAYKKFLDTKSGNMCRGDSDYGRNIRMSSGAVLNRVMDARSNEVSFRPFNPSIADYVYGRTGHEPALLADILRALRSPSALKTIDDQLENGLISQASGRRLFEQVYSELLVAHDLHLHFQLRLICVICGVLPLSREISQLLSAHCSEINKQIDYDFTNWELFVRFSLTCLKYDLIPASSFSEVFSAFSESSPDYDELEVMCSLYRKLPEREQDEIAYRLKLTAIDVWENAVQEAVETAGVLDHLLSEDDIEAASEIVLEFVEGALDEYPFRFTHYETSMLAERVDVWNIIQGNQRRQSRTKTGQQLLPPDTRKHGFSEATIDDLFQMEIPRTEG